MTRLHSRSEYRLDPATGEPYLAVSARGHELTEDPLLNKGTVFNHAERDELGLHGLLPPAVQTVEDQLTRAYGNFVEAPDDVRRYLYLTGLQDRNETLFSRLVLAHLDEMVPIIYTPTVGQACEHYSHQYRRARGLYVCSRDSGRVLDVLRNSVSADPRVIVITDNEAILGIGDQGVGGMPIAIGKLALYSVGAGIHPGQCLPLDLDVGTNNQALLDDPLYLGVRSLRLRGAAYVALLDELVEAIVRVFPNALVQWEDFASANAFAVLARYRRRLLSFNDDIQGTGAVVVAGIRAALVETEQTLNDVRAVFYGAGASGAGSALALGAALRAAGIPQHEIARRIVCLDSQGAILADRALLDGAKKDIAADPSISRHWHLSERGRFELSEVVRGFRPTVLVGASGQPGAFTETIIREMHAGCSRPIVLALSNPNSKCEATPADVVGWTNGAAVVGTGGPFAPVLHNGITRTIGQGNNVLIFPGVGLGATAVSAEWLPDEAFIAAADALVGFTVATSSRGGPIYPPLGRLREVSRHVAIAVGNALVDAGAAPQLSREEVERRVVTSMWSPENLPYRGE